MGTPGFTAGASLYRSSGRYRVSSAGLNALVMDLPATAADWTGRFGNDTVFAGPKYGYSLSDRITQEAGVKYLDCNVPGRRCCGPDAAVKTMHCHGGLGCNTGTGLCEHCGAPGEVCCDGDFTGFSNKSYTGILLDPSERIESCDTGARCDVHFAPGGTWAGTRRCQTCGNKLGGPCCAPDNRYALGRCFHDAVTGVPLACNDPWAGEGGTCVPCGQQAGQPACNIPGEWPCADGLNDKDYICVPCGQPGQSICDRGEPCRGDWSVPDRWFSECVVAGGPNQPCGKNPQLPCMNDGTFCNTRHTCEPCGHPGQPCCPPGRLPGNKACDPGECRGGRCFACGYENQPVCAGSSPCHCICEPVDGWCRPCGKEGQMCCRPSTVIPICGDGTKCDDGVCRRPAGGGGGAQPKKCNGQPYTINTLPRPVVLEDSYGCLTAQTFAADSQAEAVQCAKAAYGNAVVEDGGDEFTWSVTCNGFCSMTTFWGRDYGGAARCAYHIFPTCTILDIACP